MSEGIRAWILDRDGTLVRHVPYLHRPEEVVVLPGVRDALHWARSQGILLFLYTNQSGIHRGYYGWRQFELTQQRLYQLLGLPQSAFAEVCAAPELPDEASVYRKPTGVFIPQILRRFHLQREQCLMFGDSRVDVETALHHGIGGVALGTGDPVLAEDDPCLQNPQITYYRDWQQVMQAFCAVR
jgi:D-glycero-D-manno-heptose 1,7-bisphosphate phosphatase